MDIIGAKMSQAIVTPAGAVRAGLFPMGAREPKRPHRPTREALKFQLRRAIDYVYEGDPRSVRVKNLARDSKVAPATIKRMLAGSHGPSIDQLGFVADALHRRASQLLTSPDTLADINHPSVADSAQGSYKPLATAADRSGRPRTIQGGRSLGSKGAGTRRRRAE